MDNNLQDMIAKAVVDIIKQKEDNKGIKVGVSARHVHLSQEHLEILFGKGHELTVKKMLMGDQFAAEECVTLVSPSLRTIEVSVHRHPFLLLGMYHCLDGIL